MKNSNTIKLEAIDHIKKYIKLLGNKNNVIESRYSTKSKAIYYAGVNVHVEITHVESDEYAKNEYEHLYRIEVNGLENKLAGAFASGLINETISFTFELDDFYIDDEISSEEVGTVIDIILNATGRR